MTSPFYRLIKWFEPGPVLEYVLDRNIIPRHRICPNELCQHRMNIQEKAKDQCGYIYRCCRCKRALCLRKGTMFGETHLSFTLVLHLYLYFIVEIPNKLAAEFVDIPQESVIDWYSRCRQVCSYKMMSIRYALGGPGVVVQIHKKRMRKYKRTRSNIDNRKQWLFGMYDTSQKRGLFERLHDESEESILSIVQKYIRPGSIIHSHLLPVYSRLSQLGYDHHTMNRAVNFTDPVTGVCLNEISAFWSRLTKKVKSLTGFHGEKIWGHMDEIQYRMWFKYSELHFSDQWELFLSHVTEYFDRIRDVPHSSSSTSPPTVQLSSEIHVLSNLKPEDEPTQKVFKQEG